MAGKLNGKRVAILVADGFEQVELTQPRRALDDVDAKTVLISSNPEQVKGWEQDRWGDSFPVDVPLDNSDPNDYEALLLPGGEKNATALRFNPQAINFIRAFFDAGKPVAAICHGPLTLIDAGVVLNKTLTSWPSLETEFRNSGANWVDQEVVVDNGLVTSRKPDDIPAFNEKMIEEFREGIHGSARARMEQAA
jgi:protease I